MFSRSIFSNYLGSMLGLAVSKGLRFFGIVLCVRMVGNYDWGQSVSTIAMFTFATFLIDQGLGSSPLLFQLSNRAADKRLLWLISSYRVTMAILLIALLNAFHYAVHPVDPLIRLYAWVLVPRALTVDWWFLRRQLYQVTLLIGSVRTLLFFALVVSWVHHGVGAATILVIEMVSEAASIAFGYLLIHFRRGKALESGAPAFGLRELLVFSFPFLLLGVLNTVQGSMDVLLIRMLKGSESVALYDVGTKIGFLYFFLGATMVQIIRPKLTLLSEKEDGIQRMGVILRMTSSVLLLLTCLFLVPSLFFSPEILQTVFHTRQEVTITVFRWVGLWVAVSFMTMLCADTLLSMGRRRDYVRGAFICATVNIAANFALIHFFSGYGAIFAKILSEAVFLGTALIWLPARIRREIAGVLGFQFAVVASLVGFYLLYRVTGFRTGWLALAALLVGYAVVRGKVLTRETLTVLREN